VSEIYPGHTPAASALTRFFLDSFRFHSDLIAAGERLTKPFGLTAARWQVLSTVARADRPETVANIGRLMGLTRQAVQRVVNDMMQAGLLESTINPHHKRAVLVCTTPRGREIFDELSAQQVVWANALAEGLSEQDIERATAIIGRITLGFQARVGESHVNL
jgi:DNA-binding MarR family transcriptional regulator